MKDRIVTETAIYACPRCCNNNICQKINMRLEQLDALVNPESQRMLQNIKTQLNRNGFNYPSVSESAKCWLFDKIAVATFYGNKLDETYQSCTAQSQESQEKKKFIA